MDKTNKWGKWYLSEDGTKLLCQIKNYRTYPIDLLSCQTQEQRNGWVQKFTNPSSGFECGMAIRRIDHDPKGLSVAFRDLYGE